MERRIHANVPSTMSFLNDTGQKWLMKGIPKILEKLQKQANAAISNHSHWMA